MNIDVKIIGSEVLRKKAKVVEKPFSKLKTFVKNMIETMGEENGVGLAAPQAGRSLRLFIYDVSKEEDEEDPKICINPEITYHSDEKETAEEGCLSIPEIYGNVERSSKVTLTAYGLDGFRFKIEAEGLEARVIQHEHDHLEGILFVDHVDEEEMKKLNKKVDKLIQKGSKK